MPEAFKIIQGGMGVAVSNWRLASAVSRLGQLGVVSGTGLAVVFVRRLQLGDPGGNLRRAMAAFPFQDVVQKILKLYFIPNGKSPAKPFKLTPLPDHPLHANVIDLTILANFCEVFLAKEGHNGLVGINYLEKIQIPMIVQLFGAMLAGVDYVLIGAGIPRYVPGLLDSLSRGEKTEMRLDIEGALPGEESISSFDPIAYCRGNAPILKRPQFLAIVSSATLAMTLARKSNGKVDGFVVESSIAGGHNAPPRGLLQLTCDGQPIYGQRDQAELDKIRALNLPFYLAGGCASQEKLADALANGASGIQVGTAFAFCSESGIDSELKQRVIEISRHGDVDVFTDPSASPTSFPFKVVQVKGTLSDAEVYHARNRICDLGYLRKVFRKPDGTLGYRCAAEPVESYLRKGGTLEETAGRKCICNALFATVGLAQFHPQTGYSEPPILTAGSAKIDLSRFCHGNDASYSAAEVVAELLG